MTHRKLGASITYTGHLRPLPYRLLALDLALMMKGNSTFPNCPQTICGHILSINKVWHWQLILMRKQRLILILFTEAGVQWHTTLKWSSQEVRKEGRKREGEGVRHKDRQKQNHRENARVRKRQNLLDKNQNNLISSPFILKDWPQFPVTWFTESHFLKPASGWATASRTQPLGYDWLRKDVQRSVPSRNIQREKPGSMHYLHCLRDVLQPGSAWPCTTTELLKSESACLPYHHRLLIEGKSARHLHHHSSSPKLSVLGCH